MALQQRAKFQSVLRSMKGSPCHAYVWPQCLSRAYGAAVRLGSRACAEDNFVNDLGRELEQVHGAAIDYLVGSIEATQHTPLVFI